MTAFENHTALPASPAPNETPDHWRTAIRGLWQSVAFPDQFFTAELRPGFAVVPLLVLSLVKIGLVRAQIPYLLQAIRSSFPDSVRDPNAVLQRYMWPQYVGGVVAPVLAVSAFALILYLVASSAGHLVRFANVFVMSAYGWSIYGLKSIFTFVLLSFHGVESIAGPDSLQPPVGLGLLFRNGSSLLQGLADSINVFDICFVIIIAVAVHKSEKLHPKAAAWTAAAAWLVLQIFHFGGVYLFQQVVG
jgi:hypothetical protein